LSKSADNGFFAASSSVSEDGQTFILGHDEWDVCDGGHWLDVMKKMGEVEVKRQPARVILPG
jgi:hypothetical protein